MNPAEPPPATENSTTEEGQHERRVHAVRVKIEDAFNLCCPGKKADGTPCGKTLATFNAAKCDMRFKLQNNAVGGPSSVLAPLLGCHAAKCDKDDGGCGTYFCYLCLKPQGDSRASHAHVGEHLGSAGGSEKCFEGRDAFTGEVPDIARGETYQEFEECKVVDINQTAGSDEKPVTTRKESTLVCPLKYTSRYHWLIVRERLEILLQYFKASGQWDLIPEALVHLETFLRSKKMWPFPVGPSTETWISIVNADFQLDQKNKILLLQNELVFLSQKLKGKRPDSREAMHEETERRTELLKAILTRMDAKILTSLDVNDTGQNNPITPLLANDPDPKVMALVADLKQNHPEFWALGGDKGRISLITAPAPSHPDTPRIPPFVFSGEVPRKPDGNLYTYEEAIRYCNGIGGRLPTLAEVLALNRMLNTSSSLRGSDIWTSKVRSEPESLIFKGRKYISFRFGSTLGERDSSELLPVRCVRSI